MTHENPSVGAMIRRDIAPEHIVEHARDLERAGLDELWVVEDLPFAGGISQMTAVLGATERVTVGHGIAPAPFRTAAALAMEWATLERMFPGRVACGLGHGVQSWMAQLGEAVASPLTLIEETCVIVRELLAGGMVDQDGRYATARGVELEFPPPSAPLVSLGVVGPKSLELSGACADGTILAESHGPDQIAAARSRIAAGQEKAGRSDHHRITVFAAYHVGDEGDIVRNPAAPVGWEAVSEDPVVVARALATLVDAGADSVILVPLATDPINSLQVATEEVVPTLLGEITT